MILTEPMRRSVQQPVARTALLLCSLSAILGVIEAWLGRNEMNSDGVSYLDVADAFLRGDWTHFVNAYWSPLYPAFLAVGNWVFRPAPDWQFPVVHLVNLAIFFAAMGAFHYFLRGVVQYHEFQSEPSRVGLSESSWLLMGYALFLWTSLRLITVAVVSPDMAVAACVYFAAGALLRISIDPDKLWNFGMLGLALGLGYLAKAPMFPLGLVFLGVCVVICAGARRPARGILMTVAMWAAFAGPFVTVLSYHKGRFSLGDSANLNYVWYVNHIPRYHWHGDVLGSGVPSHATTRIFSTPAIYTFNGYGTYPVWEDPARWHEGMRDTHLDPRSIATQLITHGLMYFELFKLQGVLVVCLFGLLLIGRSQKGPWRALLDQWPLWTISVAALCMYAAVHVETRMIAAFLVLLWMGLFGAVSLPPMNWSERVIAAFMGVTSGFLLLTVAASTLGQMATNPRQHLRVGARSSEASRIAHAFQDAGLAPGDRVAWIRPNPFDERQNYWWARLAGLKIIAEVPVGQSEAFWSAAPAVRDQAIHAIGETGAKVLIATSAPVLPSLGQWQALGNTGYYILPLQATH